MTVANIIILLLGLLGVTGAISLAYVFIGGKEEPDDIRGLMTGGASTQTRGQHSIEDIAIATRPSKNSGKKKKQQQTIAKKLFRAGLYSTQDRRSFAKMQLVAPLIAVPVITGIMWILFGNVLFTVVGLLLGVMVGFVFPVAWLDRQVARREDETLFHLPLVIEQIAIGVSSALDVGPCITQIVQLAQERESLNPVTEMFLHVEKLIRSGLSLDQALVEVGETNGMPDVKHAFMFLAQCAKHGGEISKQLHELADAVMTQRQIQVEAKINALPVKATGPLAAVFGGFFLIMLAGLFVRLAKAFSS